MEIIRNAVMPTFGAMWNRSWPFKHMNVGDAVKIPAHLKARAQIYVHVYGKQSDKKFVTRTVAGELMVYRVA